MSEPVVPTPSGQRVRAYQVVANDEGQFSIWLAGRPLPAGWSSIGQPGNKEECLSLIAGVWTDITPRSARLLSPAI